MTVSNSDPYRRKNSQWQVMCLYVRKNVPMNKMRREWPIENAPGHAHGEKSTILQQKASPREN